jgi:putative heme iron utilization protein
MTEILATEATLSTLRVEIKALAVSGKQMTLAVFRQLPQMDTTSAVEELWPDAAYWGTVRYTIKDEGDLWAVIEQDGKLYRGRIVNYGDRHYYGSESNSELQEADRQHTAAWDARNEAEKEREDCPEFDNTKYPYPSSPYPPLRADEKRNMYEHIYAEYRAKDDAEYQVNLAEQHTAQDEYQAQRDAWTATQKEKIERLKAAQAEADRHHEQVAKKYSHRHNAAMDILRALPELFIAV